jgi:hypothetical protein
MIRDLPVGIMVPDEKGKIICFNVTAQRILGLEALDVGPNNRTPLSARRRQPQRGLPCEVNFPF